jgi:hypothetical protein
VGRFGFRRASFRGSRPRGRAGALHLRPALGDAVETFIRLEDAERFIAKVRGDDPEIAAKLRIEEREPDHCGGEASGRDSLEREKENCG